MYGVGDTVLYGSQGVCRIAGKEQRRLRGEYVDYFVLRPVYDENSTVYVPCANDKLISKMKDIMTCSQAQKMVENVVKSDPEWITDDNERKLRFQEILNSGDRLGTLMLIKSLYLHRVFQEERGRHLHQNDETMLKQAEKLVYGELALALGMTPEEVLPYIMKRVVSSTAVQNPAG